MIISAELVNLVAGCLLAVAMFYLGKEFFDRRVGFWTAAVFQCLPVAARVTSDVLSEATFLLATTVTLLLAVRSLRDYSIWRLGLCGACGGFCFLIRPEGGLTVLAVAVALFGQQAMARWRRPWRQVVPAAASLTLAAILVAGPYVAVLGQLTNKPTSQKVIDLASEDLQAAPEGSAEDRGSRIEDRESKIENPRLNNKEDEQSSAQDRQRLTSSISDPRSSILHPRCPKSKPRLSASLWAVWWHADRDGSWLENLTWAVWALTQEVIRCFGYIAWLPAAFGLYWRRGQWRKQPEILILGFLCLFQALVLCRVGLVVGYVSERHVLIIALCGLYWAVWAVFYLTQSRKAAKSSALASWRLDARFNLPVIILLSFMLACLPVTLQSLHANQVGHRQAGLWLAQHTQPCDIIVDPFDWAYFYAGRVFQDKTP
ncbi:MAG TPA: glycosyltransferase family 39 protein, partial [Gemmataceae bacterium]|nr:glycosyltransferase family 39 protein [Gemmataceae bacterium]